MAPLQLSRWKATGLNMISGSTASGVFSTEVKLQLQIQGELLPISATGPDRFVLATPQLLASRDAFLVVTINGEPRTTQILIAPQFEATRDYRYQRL